MTLRCLWSFAVFSFTPFNVSYLRFPVVNNSSCYLVILVVMDYEEEQRNEIEALESIYFNELKGKKL